MSHAQAWVVIAQLAALDASVAAASVVVIVRALRNGRS
jgi:hypothetical protein